MTKRLTKETISTFEVEDFAHFLISKHHTVSTLRAKVKGFSLPSNQEKKILDRIDFAEKRVEKPLSWGETFLLIVIPFGYILTSKMGSMIIGSQEDSDLFDLEKEKRLGFKRRVAEFYIYSIVGICTYVAVISIASSL